MERLNLTKLRSARRKCHLTAEKVAEHIGKQRSAIYSYETGTSEPRIGTLLKMLQLYKLSILDVFVRDL